jgi:hypothetical protein
LLEEENMRRRFFALLAAALALVIAGCPLEGDNLENRPGLDERLYGVWRFEYGAGYYEEVRISKNAKNPNRPGALTYGTYTDKALGFQETFAGDVVYAKNFSDSAGVIIVEYWPDHKQVWIDWDKSAWPNNLVPRNPQPAGSFYGIYVLNMNNAGTQAYIACTKDQNNNNGPTETKTLDEAIAKFTQGNLNQLLDLSVGDPQRKVEDY